MVAFCPPSEKGCTYLKRQVNKYRSFPTDIVGKYAAIKTFGQHSCLIKWPNFQCKAPDNILH